MRQQAEVSGDGRLLLLAEDMRRRECAIWSLADLSLYLSQEEAAMARALQPAAEIGAIVPYWFDRFPEPRRAPSGYEIIFVAGFAHPPNEDAAVWFVSEILPLIRAKVGEARLSIIGSNPTQLVRGLAGADVAVFGNVSEGELDAAYGRARVAVVPLRCGAGVKLKVVEALRAGVPLVTTQVGAQGLAGVFEAALVRDDPAQFADAVLGLLGDDAGWENHSARQVEFARARFSAEALTASVVAAFGPSG
jgi:glycosyltransferase involved in cell wall biosynthesis